MKIFWARMMAGMVLGITLAVAAPGPPGPAAKPPARDMATLVGDLADENFRVREQATREIWDLGEAALPALHEALGSSDPEQVYRARELIRTIQLHLTPDTDPAVIALVERYAKASTSEKSALLAKMRVKHAWRQMLKLYASETRPEVREKLQMAVDGVAVKAARERLARGDVREAREFLELAPADTEGLLALADFHRSQGTLDDELKRAREIPGPKSQSWQLALQRAAGDLDAAGTAATGAGQQKVAAAMAALAGDPLPWLLERAELQNEEAPDPLGALYGKLASQRWQGQTIRPADLEPLIHRLSARNRSERLAAIHALLALGEADGITAAEAAYAKAAPLDAFHYFDALERIPEALAALGLDPAHPDYALWVEQQFQRSAAADIEDQHEPAVPDDPLGALASFLERRGLLDEAMAAFSKPLAALAEKNAHAFSNLLGKWFGNSESRNGAPLLASRVGIAWAGEDDKRWDELVQAVLGDDELTRAWWTWLAELDPKATRAARFEGMLVLVELGTDPDKTREKWLGLAWAAVAAAPAGERPALVARISALSLLAGDVANSLKAWDQLPESERNEIFWGQHILNLSAVDRWDEVATVVLQQIALDQQAQQEPSVHYHAYAAAALRRAGRLEEAATHDRWVDQLALGNPTAAIQIGNGYAFGRDYPRAGEWWARAARMADPESDEFVIALKLVSDLRLDADQWKEAAATSEVLCRIAAVGNYRDHSPLPVMCQRLSADMARALDHLKTDRAGALALLTRCHHQFAGDGSLADFFFPALRHVGLLKEHDAWFAETWTLLTHVIACYPHSDNTRNTAAWFAARALKNLDEAESLLATAVAANPTQSAYLDTMAEIQFAMGHREKALAWSKAAVNFAPINSLENEQFRRQQERFHSAPLPK